MAEWGLAGQVRFGGKLRAFQRTIVILGALALAGCQTLVPRTQVPSTPPPKNGAGPEVQQGLPVDHERHRIALLVPLTGPNAGVGQSIANATTMALLDTKTDRIRVTTYDTGKGAAQAAKRALAEGNKLILGPLTAANARAVAPIAQAAKVPVISYSNDVSVAGNGVYLLGYMPSQSIKRIVDYAHAQGLSHFAALVPRGLYGERAGSAFLADVRAAGGTVVGLEVFDRNAASVTAAVKRLSTQSSYDALLIADVARIAMRGATLARANGGQSARLLGTELWNAEAGLPAVGPLKDAWFASVPDGLYQRLATKYRAAYGKAPYRIASLGYDSVLLTVRIAGNWKPDTAFPTKRLSDSGGFAGIDGAFRFDSNGVAQRALEVQEVAPDGLKVISPAPTGFGN